MKLHHFAWILVPLVALVPLPVTAQGAEIVVDVQSDGTTDDDYCTLREAISAANTNDAGSSGCEDGSSDGVDVIVLPAGTYEQR